MTPRLISTQEYMQVAGPSGGLLEPQTRDILLTLACVSNAFKEPALDILWRVLPNLSPLLRLFPTECITFKPTGSGQNKLVSRLCHASVG
jgi:hypothetical protein